MPLDNGRGRPPQGAAPETTTGADVTPTKVAETTRTLAEAPCCRECLVPLDDMRSDTVFCSSPCRQKAYRDRRRAERVDRDFWSAVAGMFRFMGDGRNASECEAMAASRNAPAWSSRNAARVLGAEEDHVPGGAEEHLVGAA